MRIVFGMALLFVFACAAPAKAQVDREPLNQDWTDISTPGGACIDDCCRCKKGCSSEYDRSKQMCNDGPASGKTACLAEAKRHYYICLCGRCAESCNDLQGC